MVIDFFFEFSFMQCWYDTLRLSVALCNVPEGFVTQLHGEHSLVHESLAGPCESVATQGFLLANLPFVFCIFCLILSTLLWCCCFFVVAVVFSSAVGCYFCFCLDSSFKCFIGHLSFGRRRPPLLNLFHVPSVYDDEIKKPPFQNVSVRIKAVDSFDRLFEGHIRLFLMAWYNFWWPYTTLRPDTTFWAPNTTFSRSTCALTQPLTRVNQSPCWNVADVFCVFSEAFWFRTFFVPFSGSKKFRFKVRSFRGWGLARV